MNKPEINQEVYEQYLDATVALFMEHYSAMLTEKISSEVKDEEVAFPEALDLKCKVLIKKEASKQKRLTLWKHTKRTMKIAAAFAIAVLTTFSMLFVSVEAFRIRVINFYIENNDGHWSINSNQDYQQEDFVAQTVKFDIDNPLKGLISDDYKLLDITNSDPQRISAIYENTNRDVLLLTTLPYNSLVQIDVENADLSKKINILGFDAVFTIKNNSSQITWCNKETGMMYIIVADNTSETEILTIAEKLITVIDN